MQLDRLFQLSFFITLGLAACCLALAELFFLPWLGVTLPFLFGAFVLAWLKEGEWVLGETAANYLGIVIALAACAWILFHVPTTEEQILASGVPWPAGLLPQLAPVLLILLAVKLFRPKRLADFWVIQTIGLMMVTLGCVLAYQEAFGVMLMLYVAALLWCLTLFHFYREQRQRRGPDAADTLFDPVDQVRPATVTVRLPGRLFALAPVLAWLALIVVTTMPLFLVLPRTSAQQWVPQKLSGIAPRARKMQTGIEAGIDLYRVGHVEPSREEAFRVTVSTAPPERGGKPCNLPALMYWRGDVLDFYERGRWQDWRLIVEQFGPFKKAPLPALMAPPTAPAAPRPPGTFYLRFSLRPGRSGQLILAEPVEVFEEQKRIDQFVGLDAQIGERSTRVPLFHVRAGCDALMPYVLTSRQSYRYGQELHLPEQRQRVPIGDVSDEYRAYLLDQPVPPDISEWTRELVRHQQRLQAADLAYDDKDRLVLDSQGKVARVLSDYLAHSGLFTYSLELRRKDYNADPTVDFLLNTKQGHCERYASGLALMLRSLGIPSRIIKGFRDAEPIVADDLPEEASTEGAYVVRQAQAHSWVQALVPDEGQWVWLNLDPTPAIEAPGADGASALAWLLQNLRDGRQFWTNFILEYNNEIQTASAKSLGEELGRGLRWGARYAAWGVPPLLLLPLGWYAQKRWRRAAVAAAAKNSDGAPPFYARYLRVLADRFDLAPQLGQTPLEFNRLAAEVLQADAQCRAWSDLPARYTDALYRVDFGGQSLAAAEEAALSAQIAALDSAAARAA